MRTTIILRDRKCSASAGVEWTAAVKDENGEDLADPAVGCSRSQALAALVANISRQFPGFSEVA